MPYEFYKVLHFLGLILTLSGLIGLMASFLTLPSELPRKLRVLWMSMHGTGLLIILVSGFGLAARLGLVGGLPTWVKAKIAVWVVVGFIIIFIRKMKTQIQIWLPLVLVLFTLAAYLAVNKIGV